MKLSCIQPHQYLTSNSKLCVNKQIFSHAPLRITFAGGQSDLPSFFLKYGHGCVVSAAISMYCITSISSAKTYRLTNFPHELQYKFLDQIQRRSPFEIIKSVLSYFNIPPLQMFCYSSVPFRSGLGGSASQMVSIIGAILKYIHEFIPENDGLILRYFNSHDFLCKKAIAHLAHSISSERMGVIGGMQDEFGVAIPGVKKIVFTESEVQVIPLKISPDRLYYLENSLVLVPVGARRGSSSQIHRDLARRMDDKKTANRILSIRTLAEQLWEELLKENIRAVGEILHEGWEKKKECSPLIATSKADLIYKFACQNGAVGGKLCGAGGGGYLLLFCPYGSMGKLQNALQINGLKPSLVKFDKMGLQARVDTCVYSSSLVS